MADVRFTNNSDEVSAALRDKIPVALEAIGLKAEGYAKRLAPVDTGNLRKNITHTVSGDTAVIGTNVEYAA